MNIKEKIRIMYGAGKDYRDHGGKCIMVNDNQAINLLKESKIENEQIPELITSWEEGWREENLRLAGNSILGKKRREEIHKLMHPSRWNNLPTRERKDIQAEVLSSLKPGMVFISKDHGIQYVIYKIFSDGMVGLERVTHRDPGCNRHCCAWGWFVHTYTIPTRIMRKEELKSYYHEQ